MKNPDTRKLTPVSELEPGQYFSLPDFPDVPLKCRSHTEEARRISAICCDPWYHKVAVPYEESVLLGFPA